MFYVVGRQKIMTDFMKRLARFKGSTPEVMSLGTGEPVAVGLCNKKLKVSKKIVFQDESSTQVKLPQYALPVLRQNQQIPTVPRFSLKKCRTDLPRSR